MEDTLNGSAPSVDQDPTETEVAASLKRILVERGDLEPEEDTQDQPAQQAAQEPEASEQREGGDEEGEEGGEAAEESPTEPEVVEFVTEDGVKLQIPAPLKDAFLRQADYTRKTMELAEERRVVAQLREVNERTHAIAQQMGPVIAQFHIANQNAERYGQIDWDALYDSDPLLHNRLKLEARENLDKLQTLGRQLMEAPRMLEESQRLSVAAEAARNLPLARQLVPDFESRKGELVGVGRMYGFSDEEIQSSPDARVVKALADLADYHKLRTQQQGVLRKVSAAPPVVRPGQRSAPAKEIDRTRQRIRRGDNSTDAFVEAMRAQRGKR